jgi:hypothetical protein
VLDGRNSLVGRDWPSGIAYRGIGVPGTLSAAQDGPTDGVARGETTQG